MTKPAEVIFILAGIFILIAAILLCVLGLIMIIQKIWGG